MLVPIFVFSFAYRSKIIIVLFPFKYPMNDDTRSFGGMLNSMWIWSGIACASIISTLFLLHNSLNIFPISARNAPYITFLWYFGVNTI